MATEIAHSPTALGRFSCVTGCYLSRIGWGARAARSQSNRPGTIRGTPCQQVPR
jgi:hypothetical protein